GFLGFTMNTDSYKGKPRLQDVLSLNNQDFEPTQTSFQAAMEEFKQLLNVLDQDELEELQDAMSDDGDKERLEEEEAEKLKEAKFLATVHNVHKVTAIAWIPQIIPNTQVVNPRRYPDCSLKGHWVIKYLNDDNEEDILDAATRWMEASFSHTSLAYAQQIAYETLNPIIIKKDNGKTETRTGFVDVERENIVITLGGSTFHKVKYIPASITWRGGKYKRDKKNCIITKRGEPVLNPDSERIDHPAKWIVWSKDTRKSEEIAEEILKESVTTEFLELVKRCGSQSTKKWVHIPPGDSKEHAEFPKDLEQGVPIHYRQPAGERVCLVASFASFLHSVHCIELAANLYSVRHQIQEKISIWQDFYQYLGRHSYFLRMEKLVCDDDPIETFGRLKVPIVICVVDSNGQEDHSVTIYKNWIFDANFSHALPLQKKSLDYCCSSDTQQLTFMGVSKAYIFPAFDKYLSEMNIENKAEKERAKQNKKRKRKESQDKKSRFTKK
ncbi:MAG TPA: hypothetical protein VIQ31_37305, partial [Phormidium sp.]